MTLENVISTKRCKEMMQSVTIEVGYVGFESIKVDAKNKNENKSKNECNL